MGDEAKLLPCPFCGAGRRPTDLIVRRHPFHVTCTACAAQGGMAVDRTTAIAAWNRRTPTEET